MVCQLIRMTHFRAFVYSACKHLYFKKLLMYRLACMNRFCLWNELSSVFTIIIWPAMYFRNIARPVTMTRIDWCCPLECICTPWILCSYFSSFKNGIKEIEYKHQVHCKYNDRHNSDHFVQVIKLVE